MMKHSLLAIAALSLLVAAAPANAARTVHSYSADVIGGTCAPNEILLADAIFRTSNPRAVAWEVRLSDGRSSSGFLSADPTGGLIYSGHLPFLLEPGDGVLVRFLNSRGRELARLVVTVSPRSCFIAPVDIDAVEDESGLD